MEQNVQFLILNEATLLKIEILIYSIPQT